MNSIDRPRASRSSARIAITSDWVVTSSAVVGSSARRSFGPVRSAAAIITRCSMPPDSSWGNWRRRLSPWSMPTDSSRFTAAARAPDGLISLWAMAASVMKSPMRRTGLMCARGSWNTIATCVRNVRSSAADEPSGLPSKRIDPPIRAPGGSSRSIAFAVIDFPEPDSPTSPMVSPWPIVRSMPDSTRRYSPPTGRSSVRPSISRTGAALIARLRRRPAGTAARRAG